MKKRIPASSLLAFLAIFLFMLPCLLFSGGILSEGGNITQVNASIGFPSVWHGVRGNVSGSAFSPLTISAAPNEISNSTITTGSGSCQYGTSSLFLLFRLSQNTSSPLFAGSLPALDLFLASPRQNASGTFTSHTVFSTQKYGTISSVPTVYTRAFSGSMAFRTGYLQDASGNFVFITEPLASLPGFDNTSVNFQVMLPTNGTALNYSVEADLNCSASPTPPSPPTPSGGGGGGGGGGMGTPGGYALSSSIIFVDIGKEQLCKVSVSRAFTNANNHTVLITTIENLGWSACTLYDFSFIDVIPLEFGSVDEISFSPDYFASVEQTVVFVFPVFSPGESRTLAYTKAGTVPPNRIKLFDNMRVSAVNMDFEPANNTSAPSNGTSPECVPDLFCGEWGPCLDGVSTQTCKDFNRCTAYSFFHTKLCSVEPNETAIPLAPVGTQGLLERQIEILDQARDAFCAEFPPACNLNMPCMAAAGIALAALAAIILKMRKKPKPPEHALRGHRQHPAPAGNGGRHIAGKHAKK